MKVTNTQNCFIASEPKRFSKSCGIERISSRRVTSRVRLASTIHASSEPKIALPSPGSTPHSPYFQPVPPA